MRTKEEMPTELFAVITGDVNLSGSILVENMNSFKTSKFIINFLMDYKVNKQYDSRLNIDISTKELDILINKLTSSREELSNLMNHTNEQLETHKESSAFYNKYLQHQHNIAHLKQKFSKKIATEILKLKPNDSKIIYGGWQGHAINLYFKSNKDGSILFCIYNSGSGLNTFHQTVNKKTPGQFFKQYYSAAKLFKIPADEKNKKDFPQKFEAFIANLQKYLIMHTWEDEISKQINNREYFYTSVINHITLLGGYEVDQNEEKNFTFPTTSSQRSGTCAQKSFHVLLQSFLGREKFKKMKYEWQKYAIELKLYELRNNKSTNSQKLIDYKNLKFAIQKISKELLKLKESNQITIKEAISQMQILNKLLISLESDIPNPDKLASVCIMETKEAYNPKKLDIKLPNSKEYKSKISSQDNRLTDFKEYEQFNLDSCLSSDSDKSYLHTIKEYSDKIKQIGNHKDALKACKIILEKFSQPSAHICKLNLGNPLMSQPTEEDDEFLKMLKEFVKLYGSLSGTLKINWQTSTYEYNHERPPNVDDMLVYLKSIKTIIEYSRTINPDYPIESQVPAEICILAAQMGESPYLVSEDPGTNRIIHELKKYFEQIYIKAYKYGHDRIGYDSIFNYSGRNRKNIFTYDQMKELITKYLKNQHAKNIINSFIQKHKNAVIKELNMYNEIKNHIYVPVESEKCTIDNIDFVIYLLFNKATQFKSTYTKCKYLGSLVKKWQQINAIDNAMLNVTSVILLPEYNKLSSKPIHIDYKEEFEVLPYESLYFKFLHNKTAIKINSARDNPGRLLRLNHSSCPGKENQTDKHIYERHKYLFDTAILKANLKFENPIIESICNIYLSKSAERLFHQDLKLEDDGPNFCCEQSSVIEESKIACASRHKNQFDWEKFNTMSKILKDVYRMAISKDVVVDVLEFFKENCMLINDKPDLQKIVKIFFSSKNNFNEILDLDFKYKSTNGITTILKIRDIIIKSGRIGKFTCNSTTLGFELLNDAYSSYLYLIKDPANKEVMKEYNIEKQLESNMLKDIKILKEIIVSTKENQLVSEKVKARLSLNLLKMTSTLIMFMNCKEYNCQDILEQYLTSIHEVEQFKTAVKDAYTLKDIQTISKLSESCLKEILNKYQEEFKDVLSEFLSSITKKHVDIQANIDSHIIRSKQGDTINLISGEIYSRSGYKLGIVPPEYSDDSRFERFLPKNISQCKIALEHDYILIENKNEVYELGKSVNDQIIVKRTFKNAGFSENKKYSLEDITNFKGLPEFIRHGEFDIWCNSQKQDAIITDKQGVIQYYFHEGNLMRIANGNINQSHYVLAESNPNTLLTAAIDEAPNIQVWVNPNDKFKRKISFVRYGIELEGELLSSGTWEYFLSGKKDFKLEADENLNLGMNAILVFKNKDNKKIGIIPRQRFFFNKNEKNIRKGFKIRASTTNHQFTLDKPYQYHLLDRFHERDRQYFCQNTQVALEFEIENNNLKTNILSDKLYLIYIHLATGNEVEGLKLMQEVCLMSTESLTPDEILMLIWIIEELPSFNPDEQLSPEEKHKVTPKNPVILSTKLHAAYMLQRLKISPYNPFSAKSENNIIRGDVTVKNIKNRYDNLSYTGLYTDYMNYFRNIRKEHRLTLQMELSLLNCKNLVNVSLKIRKRQLEELIHRKRNRGIEKKLIEFECDHDAEYIPIKCGKKLVTIDEELSIGKKNPSIIEDMLSKMKAHDNLGIIKYDDKDILNIINNDYFYIIEDQFHFIFNQLQDYGFASRISNDVKQKFKGYLEKKIKALNTIKHYSSEQSDSIARKTCLSFMLLAILNEKHLARSIEYQIEQYDDPQVMLDTKKSIFQIHIDRKKSEIEYKIMEKSGNLLTGTLKMPEHMSKNNLEDIKKYLLEKVQPDRLKFPTVAAAARRIINNIYVISTDTLHVKVSYLEAIINKFKYMQSNAYKQIPKDELNHVTKKIEIDALTNHTSESENLAPNNLIKAFKNYINKYDQNMLKIKNEFKALQKKENITYTTRQHQILALDKEAGKLKLKLNSEILELSKHTKFLSDKQISNIHQKSTNAIKKIQIESDNLLKNIRKQLDIQQFNSLSVDEQLMRESGAHLKIKNMSDEQFIAKLVSIYLSGTIEDYKEIYTNIKESDAKLIHNNMNRYLNLKIQESHLQRIKKLSNKSSVNRLELLKELMSQNLVTKKEHQMLQVFQYYTGFHLRPEQIALLSEFLKKTDGKFINKEAQMNMGAGKTKVLTPILATAKANGNNLSIIEVPDALYKTNLTELNADTVKYFGKRCFSFDFTRESTWSFQRYKQEYYRLCLCMLTKSYVVTRNSSVASLQLKVEELREQHKNCDKEIKQEIINKMFWAQKILNTFKYRGDVLVDEVHTALTTRKQLHYAVGNKHPMNPKKIKYIVELLGFIHTKVNANIIGSADSMSEKNILLNIYDIKNILIDKGCQGNGPFAFLTKLTSNEQDIVRMWLPPGDKVKKLPATLLNNLSRPDKECMMVIFKELTTILPLVLSKKYKKDFGPDGSAIAHPYRDGELISNAEFGTTEEIAHYTIRQHLINGLDDSKIKLLIEGITSLHNIELVQEIRLKKTNKELPTDMQLIVNDFFKNTEFNFDLDKVILGTYEYDEFLTALKNNKKATLYYLEHYCLPGIKYDTRDIKHNAINHISLYNSFHAFTGTPYNFRTTNRKIPFNQVDSLGINGITIAKLIDNDTSIFDIEDQSNLKQYMEKYSIETPDISRFRAIIDIGATFTSIKNEAAAKIICDFLRDKKDAVGEIEWVLFFNEDNNLCAMRLGKDNETRFEIRVIGSTKPEDIKKAVDGCDHKKIFTYYNYAHIYGTDIQQIPGAQALATCGNTTEANEMWQGIMRMRKFQEGQEVTFLLSNTTKNAILKNNEEPSTQEQKVNDKEPICIGELIAFVQNNQTKRALVENFEAAVQDIHNEVREKFIELRSAANDLSLEERLTNIAGPLFQNHTNDSIDINRLAAAKNSKEVAEILQDIAKQSRNIWNKALSLFKQKKSQIKKFDNYAAQLISVHNEIIENIIPYCPKFMSIDSQQSPTLNKTIEMHSQQQKDVEVEKDKDNQKQKEIAKDISSTRINYELTYDVQVDKKIGLSAIRKQILQNPEKASHVLVQYIKMCLGYKSLPMALHQNDSQTENIAQKIFSENILCAHTLLHLNPRSKSTFLKANMQKKAHRILWIKVKDKHQDDATLKAFAFPVGALSCMSHNLKNPTYLDALKKGNCKIWISDSRGNTVSGNEPQEKSTEYYSYLQQIQILNGDYKTIAESYTPDPWLKEDYDTKIQYIKNEILPVHTNNEEYFAMLEPFDSTNSAAYDKFLAYCFDIDNRDLNNVANNMEAQNFKDCVCGIIKIFSTNPLGQNHKQYQKIVNRHQFRFGDRMRLCKLTELLSEISNDVSNDKDHKLKDEKLIKLICARNQSSCSFANFPQALLTDKSKQLLNIINNNLPLTDNVNVDKSLLKKILQFALQNESFHLICSVVRAINPKDINSLEYGQFDNTSLLAELILKPTCPAELINLLVSKEAKIIIDKNTYYMYDFLRMTGNPKIDKVHNLDRTATNTPSSITNFYTFINKYKDSFINIKAPPNTLTDMHGIKYEDKLIADNIDMVLQNEKSKHDTVLDNYDISTIKSNLSSVQEENKVDILKLLANFYPYLNHDKLQKKIDKSSLDKLDKVMIFLKNKTIAPHDINYLKQIKIESLLIYALKKPNFCIIESFARLPNNSLQDLLSSLKGEDKVKLLSLLDRQLSKENLACLKLLQSLGNIALYDDSTVNIAWISSFINGTHKEKSMQNHENIVAPQFADFKNMLSCKYISKIINFDSTDLEGKTFLHHLCNLKHMTETQKQDMVKLIYSFLQQNPQAKQKFYYALLTPDHQHKRPVDYMQPGVAKKYINMLTNYIKDLKSAIDQTKEQIELPKLPEFFLNKKDDIIKIILNNNQEQMLAKKKTFQKTIIDALNIESKIKKKLNGPLNKLYKKLCLLQSPVDPTKQTNQDEKKHPEKLKLDNNMRSLKELNKMLDKLNNKIQAATKNIQTVADNYWKSTINIDFKQTNENIQDLFEIYSDTAERYKEILIMYANINKASTTRSAIPLIEELIENIDVPGLKQHKRKKMIQPSSLEKKNTFDQLITKIRQTTEYKIYPGFKAIIDFYDKHSGNKKSRATLKAKLKFNNVTIPGINARMVNLFKIALACVMLSAATVYLFPQALSLAKLVDFSYTAGQTMKVSLSSFFSINTVRSASNKFLSILKESIAKGGLLVLTTISVLALAQQTFDWLKGPSYELQEINNMVISDFNKISNKQKNINLKQEKD